MKYLWIIVAAMLLFACNQTEEEATSNEDMPDVVLPAGNPNGDSELALLMRQMFEESLNMRRAVLKGEKPPVSLDLAKIHTVQATEPEKQASESYKAWGTAFLNAVKMYNEAPKSEAKEAYTLMIDQCMNCHGQLCPGPTVKIKKLYLPN
jgi:hypothetical protein